jgi:hypothetical protein
MPIILTTWEAEIRRITVQNCSPDLISKMPKTKKGWAEWLKWCTHNACLATVRPRVEILVLTKRKKISNT